MARLARDAVRCYTTDSLQVKVNGVAVVPDTEVTVAAGTREAEITVVVVAGRSRMPPYSDSTPSAFVWKFAPTAGCEDAELTSPGQPTTRLQTLNPGDRAIITLEVTGKFEKQVVTFDLAVPA